MCKPLQFPRTQVNAPPATSELVSTPPRNLKSSAVKEKEPLFRSAVGISITSKSAIELFGWERQRTQNTQLRPQRKRTLFPPDLSQDLQLHPSYKASRPSPSLRRLSQSRKATGFSSTRPQVELDCGSASCSRLLARGRLGLQARTRRSSWRRRTERSL